MPSINNSCTDYTHFVERTFEQIQTVKSQNTLAIYNNAKFLEKTGDSVILLNARESSLPLHPPLDISFLGQADTHSWGMGGGGGRREIVRNLRLSLVHATLITSSYSKKLSYISTHFQSHLSLSHTNYILDDHQILLHDKGTDVATGDAFSETLTLAVTFTYTHN